MGGILCEKAVMEQLWVAYFVSGIGVLHLVSRQ